MNDLISRQAVAKRLGCCVRTIFSLVDRDPDFPAPVKLSKRLFRWRASEIEAYIKAKTER